MSPGDYPRPQPPAAKPYDGDRTWGGIIIVFSLLRLVSYGSSLGGSSLGGSSLGGSPISGPTSAQKAITVLMMGLLAIRLAGGIGLLASRRWGLLLVAASSGGYVLISLLNLTAGGSPLSLVSLALSAYIVYYCVRRLTGREGPPVA